MKLELKEGEVICPRCEGKGHLEEDRLGMSDLYLSCIRCYGDGKLDWVEIIFGKRTPDYYVYNTLTLPKLRVYFPQLIVKDLVSVQPMGP